MKKNGKRKGVSRRDFLKSLGGGAVVISSGLVKPRSAKAASAKVPVRPPVSPSAPEVQKLNAVLEQSVLPEVQKLAGQDNVLVNCRLNETGMEHPHPVWYGWVESQALRQKSGGKPLKDMIGGTNLSPIYTRCLTHAQRDYVHEIDYSQSARVRAEKTGRSRQWDVMLGLVHRRFVAIVANGRRVGTLTVGFPKPPADNDQLKKRLLHFAQDPASPLVGYLTSTFDLGGPQI